MDIRRLTREFSMDRSFAKRLETALKRVGADIQSSVLEKLESLISEEKNNLIEYLTEVQQNLDPDEEVEISIRFFREDLSTYEGNPDYIQDHRGVWAHAYITEESEVSSVAEFALEDLKDSLWQAGYFDDLITPHTYEDLLIEIAEGIVK